MNMGRIAAAACLVFFCCLTLSAQDLVITNARVIVGNGNVMDQGSIVIRGGRIASVAAGRANMTGVQTIDAKGMSALPGFIDGHRHVNTVLTKKHRCSNSWMPDTRPSFQVAVQQKETSR